MSSFTDGYNSTGAQVSQQVGTPQGGTLPFTGIDVGAVSGMGLACVVLGISVRMLTRHLRVK